MRKFVAISHSRLPIIDNQEAVHHHLSGTLITLFASMDDAVAIFNALPIDDRGDPDVETKVSFADVVLNIDFDPNRGDTLEIHEVTDTMVVDLTAYGAQTGVNAC